MNKCPEECPSKQLWCPGRGWDGGAVLPREREQLEAGPESRAWEKGAESEVTAWRKGQGDGSGPQWKDLNQGFIIWGERGELRHSLGKGLSLELQPVGRVVCTFPVLMQRTWRHQHPWGPPIRPPAKSHAVTAASGIRAWGRTSGAG